MTTELIRHADLIIAMTNDHLDALLDQAPEAALRATKKALWGALELGLTDACRAGAQELVGMWGHPDQEEGPRAFAEKRPPRWLDG